MEVKKRTLKCSNCGNIWDTKSKKQFVTCTDCLRKIPNKNIKEVNNNGKV